MAHELIDSVTATPAGPVVLALGQTLDITASYALNGPPSGSPTISVYSLRWQEVGAIASLAGQGAPVAGTEYTKTIAAEALTIGTHQFVVIGRYENNAAPPETQEVESNLIDVEVRRFVRELEATLPDREVVAGLAERAADAELPARTATAAASVREVDAELPARTATARID